MRDPVSPVPPRHRPPLRTARAARALERIVVDASAGTLPDDPWVAVRASVVDLVELTAATHVLAIHARLALATDLPGLPTSRARALRASAAVVRHQARVLLRGDPPGPWAARVAAIAEEAVVPHDPPTRALERLPRVVAQELAGALEHHGRPVGPALPGLERAAGHALALVVLAAGDGAGG